MANLIRIITNPASDGGTKTQGTQVMLGDTDIALGIRKLTLVAEPNSVWVAHIECTVNPPEKIMAELQEITHSVKEDA